ncbi:MAG: ABC transporter permease, partial [Acidocella sp.]|nr:ABC transporter permease [Acidocella sp.]
AVFALRSPGVTLLIVVLMGLIAAREMAARRPRQFARFGNYAIAGAVVGAATSITVGLALLTAIQPHPWWNPHYAIPLAGIILGSVLNAGSLSLDGMVEAVMHERPTIEAQLALGETYHTAIRPLVRGAARRGMVPIINQMSAAGIITLPGTMTGQILAGMDPLEAVKYQILLMFLLAGASGLTATGTALMAARRLSDNRQRLRLDRLGAQHDSG